MIEAILLIALGFVLGTWFTARIHKLSGKEVIGYFWDKSKAKLHSMDMVRIANDSPGWVDRFKQSILDGKKTFTNWVPGTSDAAKEAFWNEIRAWHKDMGLTGRIQVVNNLTREITSEEIF